MHQVAVATVPRGNTDVGPNLRRHIRRPVDRARPNGWSAADRETSRLTTNHRRAIELPVRYACPLASLQGTTHAIHACHDRSAPVPCIAEVPAAYLEALKCKVSFLDP